MTTTVSEKPLFTPDLKFFLVFSVVILALLYFMYEGAFDWMYHKWTTMDEYSHGIMIPFVTLYLIWLKKDDLIVNPQLNSLDFLVGYGLILAGFVAYLIMHFATVYMGMVLSFLMVLYGVFIVTLGLKNFMYFKAPLLMLLLAVPLPNFINNNLSSGLQLISSEIGVAFIRMFDIIVYLEGNVIDLGSYKLQVVDACSGLRYLFPLMALGFILAYLVDIPLWKRIVLFLATIPITVIMNSIRIGIIGVTVEHWGIEMAEGILHDIEGWFMFMASLAVLLAMLKIMLLSSKDKRSLTTVLSMGMESRKGLGGNEIDQSAEQGSAVNVKKFAAPLVLIAAFAGFTQLSGFLDRGAADVPNRLSFNHFPLVVGDWLGTPDVMEQVYLDVLKLDDYIMADYKKGSQRLNFYISYYDDQTSGQSAHSPRSCIPGGGWQIASIEQMQLGDLYLNSQPLMVNRVIIQKGDVRQVVYYWFQQRGRMLTNEYLVKWYLFKDALFDGRTDGAMIRITTPLEKSQELSVADDIAIDFMSSLVYRMNDYIPN